MASFLYFTETPDQIKPYRYAFDSEPQKVEVYANGPNNGRGFMWFDRRWTHQTERVRPNDTIQWQEIGESVWCGFYRDDRPTPADLLADDPIPGEEVMLGDGNAWQIPKARYFQDPKFVCALPRKYRLVSGRWVRATVLERHKDLWEACEKWDAAVRTSGSDADTTTIIIDEIFESVMPANRTNYRISDPEVSILGLVNEENYSHICFAMVDLSSLKKKCQGSH